MPAYWLNKQIEWNVEQFITLILIKWTTIANSGNQIVSKLKIISKTKPYMLIPTNQCWYFETFL